MTTSQNSNRPQTSISKYRQKVNDVKNQPRAVTSQGKQSYHHELHTDNGTKYFHLIEIYQYMNI